MIIEFDCAVCGTHVRKTRSPSNIKSPPRFCSQKCHGAGVRGTGKGRAINISFNCEMCGKLVETYRSPSQRKIRSTRFCSLSCLGRSQQGERNPAYSGGRYIDSNGYVHVLAPDHPGADCRGYIYEHRLVAEQMIGRRLLPAEVVHHRNEIRSDNSPENLQVFANQIDHMKHHAEQRNG